MRGRKKSRTTIPLSGTAVRHRDEGSETSRAPEAVLRTAGEPKAGAASWVAVSAGRSTRPEVSALEERGLLAAD